MPLGNRSAVYRKVHRTVFLTQDATPKEWSLLAVGDTLVERPTFVDEETGTLPECEISGAGVAFADGADISWARVLAWARPLPETEGTTRIDVTIQILIEYLKKIHGCPFRESTRVRKVGRNPESQMNALGNNYLRGLAPSAVDHSLPHYL